MLAGHDLYHGETGWLPMSKTYEMSQIDAVLEVILKSHPADAKVPSLRSMRKHFLSSGVNLDAIGLGDATLGFAYAFKGSGLGFWLDHNESYALDESAGVIRQDLRKRLKRHGVPPLQGSEFYWKPCDEHHGVAAGLAVFDRWLARVSGNEKAQVPSLRLVDIDTGGDFYAAVTCGEADANRVIEGFQGLGIRAQLATELHPGDEVLPRHLDPSWSNGIFDIVELANSVLQETDGFEQVEIAADDALWLREERLDLWRYEVDENVVVKVAIKPTRQFFSDGPITQFTPIAIVEREDVNAVLQAVTAGSSPADNQTLNDHSDSRYLLHRLPENLRDVEAYRYGSFSRDERIASETKWLKGYLKKLVKNAKSTTYAKRRLAKNSRNFQKRRRGEWVDVDGILLSLVQGDWNADAEQTFIAQADAKIARGEADAWAGEWVTGIRRWAAVNPDGIAGWQPPAGAQAKHEVATATPVENWVAGVSLALKEAGFEGGERRRFGAGALHFFRVMDSQHALTVGVTANSRNPDQFPFVLAGIARRDVNELVDLINEEDSGPWAPTIEFVGDKLFRTTPRRTQEAINRWVEASAAKLARRANLRYLNDHLEQARIAAATREGLDRSHRPRIASAMLDGWADCHETELLGEWRDTIERLGPDHPLTERLENTIALIVAWLAAHPDGVEREHV